MYKRILMPLAAMLLAGVFLSPLTAYAVEGVGDLAAVAVTGLPEDEIDADTDIGEDTDIDAGKGVDGDSGEAEPIETESGIPPYDGPKHLTPDGTATVTDNVFIEGNGLEFFTFTTEAGNTFYLVIDRARTQNNVYFLNYVTEQDLLALAEKDNKSGASTSGIPSTTSGTSGEKPTDEPETPEQPPAKSNNTGMLIFLLLGTAAVGGAAYYFKIVRPKKQIQDDDDGGDLDEDDYGDDDYLGDTDDEPDSGEPDERD